MPRGNRCQSTNCALSRYFLSIFVVFLVGVAVFFVGVVVVVRDNIQSDRRVLLLTSCGNGCPLCNVLMDLMSMFFWNEVKFAVVLIVEVFSGETG